VRRRSSISSLRWVSTFFLFAAVLLTVFQLISYSRVRGNFPPGLSIAGIPVGGLDRQRAAQRLLEAYAVPVELHYGDAVIQLKPSNLGFELDLEGMLAAADLQRVSQPFWLDFWNSLWKVQPANVDIPLLANISEDRLKKYLIDDIASRYDTPPAVAMPLPGSTSFQAGQVGTSLNVDRAVSLIEDALRSPIARVVNVTYNRTTPPRPAFSSLQIMLKQILDSAKFSGVAETYLLDLQTNQEIQFAYQPGDKSTLPPDIAFSAESTIKIPIMVSVYRRVSLPLSDELAQYMAQMMDRSENPPADSLMAKVIDPGRGPLEVTKDMQSIGLLNTFLGARMAEPVFLARFDTPANRRKDVNTDPDTYNQTSTSDLGSLLNDIYQCSTYSGGALVAAFPGEITQEKCQEMLTYLGQNKTGMLLEAGVPEGTRLAHKHAWAQANDGLIHTIGDAGIVFTPGGNYVLVVFMYDPVQLVFDPTNLLFSKLSQAVYNYYNQFR
jgi:hypothetical protein